MVRICDSTVVTISVGITLFLFLHPRPAVLDLGTTTVRLREVAVLKYGFNVREEFRIAGDSMNSALQPESITSLEDLARRNPARRLTLENTRISDLSPLAETHIQHLRLKENPEIASLEPISRMPRIEGLILEGNNGTRGYSALSKILSLRYLGLIDTKVEDLSMLSRLSQIDELRLSGIGPFDLVDLPAYRNLEYLRLGSGLISLEGIERFPKLESLRLDKLEIDDYSPILDAPALKKLRLVLTPTPPQAIVEQLRQRGVEIEYPGIESD